MGFCCLQTVYTRGFYCPPPPCGAFEPTTYLRRRPFRHSPSRIQGAAPVSLQYCPASSIGPTQQSDPPDPSLTAAQPAPPQTEQAGGQHTSPLAFSNPGKPLLHCRPGRSCREKWRGRVRAATTPYMQAGAVSRNGRNFVGHRHSPSTWGASSTD